MNKEQIEEMAKIFCGMKNGCDGCMWDKAHCNERNYAEEIYNAGYRKQSENTVAFPCKVGDTVYVIIGRLLPTIAECKVIAVTHHVISLDNDRKTFSFSVVAKNSKTPDTFIDTDIGKRVFFNKVQAEKALAKMKGGAE